MRYLVFVSMRPDVGAPPRALIDAMGEEMEQAFASGLITDGGGLPPTRTEIRVAGGQVTVTDGPFAEAKEVVGGYSMLNVESEEEAIAGAQLVIDLHLKHWPGWEGSVEVRRISDEEPDSWD
jgi:hypothetical protein